METREGQDVQVRQAPEIVGRTPRADDAPDGPAPATHRRGLVVVLAAVTALAVVLTLLLVLLLSGGDDDGRVKAKTPPADVPAGPAALGMSVQQPESVVAGTPTTLEVRWTDGTGVFSGSSEDWGDGVGTSSLKQGICAASAAIEPPAAGRFAVEHTWSEPGTYEVVLGVTTYVCENGTAVEEQASKNITVQVLPAG